MSISLPGKCTRWISGKASLGFTCWLMGVIPYMVLLQCHLFIQQFYHKGVISSKAASALLALDEGVFFIYLPLCLIAIANAAINFRGFHLWRFFAFLLFAKGGEIYFNFIMGKWPLG